MANRAEQHGSQHALIELDSCLGPEIRTYTQPAGPFNPRVQSKPALSKEQQQIVDLIVAGHNVFYTGSMGSGKLPILRASVKKLRGDNKRGCYLPANEPRCFELQ
jgi:hypothetical protein